jgi:predicted site-specific integrase-resolvase
MKNTRPKQVTIQHLMRRAIVYLRSAVFSPASLERQIAQQDFALSWGWPIDAVEIISGDAASSGLNASRIGYQCLLRMIEKGQVGLVLVADLARLSRSPLEMERFLALCQSKGTLLAVNGTIVAPAERERSLDQLRKRFAAYEKQLRACWRRARQRPSPKKGPERHQA